MKPNQSLLFRLLIGFFVIILLPLIVIFQFTLNSSREELLQQARFTYREWTISAVNKMERDSSFAIILIQSLANTPDIRSVIEAKDSNRDIDQLNRTLNSFLNAHPAFSGVAILDNRYSIIAARCRPSNSDKIECWQLNFSEPQEPFGTMSVLPVHIHTVEESDSSGKISSKLRYLLPIRNSYHEIAGIIALDFPIENWATMLATHFTAHRWIMYSSNDRLISTNLTDLNKSETALWVEKLAELPAIHGQTGKGEAVIEFNGEPALFVCAKFVPPGQSESRLQFGSIVPLREIFQPISKLRRTVMLIGLLMCVACLLFAGMYTYHVINPLHQLAHRLSTLNPRAPDQLPLSAFNTRDEIGMIAHALRSLQNQLQMAFTSLDDKIGELEQTNAELLRAKIDAEAAAQAKSDFLSVMSHEIRTPLNAIVGFSQLLQFEDTSPEDRIDYTKRVMESCDRLLELIDRILDFSRLNSGRAELDHKPNDISEMLQIVEAETIHQCRSRGLNLRLNIDPSCSGMFWIDKTRFLQVAHNLLGNAIKFTAKGTITVTGAVVNGEDEKAWLNLTFTDTGIGIAAEQIESIFEPFVQADNSQRRRYQGAGLGLAIVSKLVQLMNGTIACESTLGAGTTFRVTIPVERCTDGNMEIKAAQENRFQTLDHLHVVAVEDDPDSQYVLRHALENIGVRSFFITDQSQPLLEHMRSQHCDLVIMDMHLFADNGCRIAELIRDGQGGDSHKSVPIVCLSAFSDSTNRQRAADAGMQAYLTKPFTFPSLLEVVHQLVVDRQSAQC